jgi:hypothetical protein
MGIMYELTEEQIKELATKFFYDWHNPPGSNTEPGFDAWWEINKSSYQNTAQKALNAVFNDDFIPRFKAGDKVRVISGAHITYTNMPEKGRTYLIRHVYGGRKWTYALSDLGGRNVNIHINDEHIESAG